MLLKLLSRYKVWVLLAGVLLVFFFTAKWYIEKHESVVAEYSKLQDKHDTLQTQYDKMKLTADKMDEMAQASIDKSNEIDDLKKRIQHLLDVKVDDVINELPEGLTDEERYDIIGSVVIDSMWDFYEEGSSLRSNETESSASGSDEGEPTTE